MAWGSLSSGRDSLSITIKTIETRGGYNGYESCNIH